MSEVLRLASWYGDNMLLQQRVRSHIYGKTLPNAEVRLSLERFPAEHSYKGREELQYGLIFQEQDAAEEDGFFEFKLPFIEASFDTYRLTIESCAEKRVFQNILFGELWFTAGGSNMKMPLKYSDLRGEKFTQTEEKFIRFFSFPDSGLGSLEEGYRFEPTSDIPESRWYELVHQKRADVSATALAFARNLFERLKCPVAIIDAAANDSMIHSWLPRQINEKDAVLKNHLKEIKHYRDAKNWNSLPEEERREERSIRRPLVQKDLAAEAMPFLRRNQAGALFNHKLAPFSGMAIRGLIWSQGLADVNYPNHYQRAFRRLSNVFKSIFQAPLTGLTLIYSQLPPFLASATDELRLAEFNETLSVVRRRLAIPAGMVTIYDLPPDYQGQRGPYARPETPVAKAEVGRRMANLALALAYKHDLPESAPEIASVEALGGKLILSFSNIGAGLKLREGEKELKGFYIAGEDGVLVPAIAKDLYGVRVLLWHPEIDNPLSCAYAFSNFNYQANLSSVQGMPVVPFRLNREARIFNRQADWTYCDSLREFKFQIDHSRYENMPEEAPGYLPLWSVFNGRGQFSLERDNKREGKSAIRLEYRRADERPVSFGPIIDYISDYPPLNLSLWRYLKIMIFSADHRQKYLALKLKDSNGREFLFNKETIDESLAWQELSFDLHLASVDRLRIIELQFMIQDPGESGSLTIDGVSFTGLNTVDYGEDRTIHERL